MPNDNYTCDCCGKIFIPHPSTVKRIERGEQKTLSCSRECSSQLKRRTVTTYCENCGTEIHRKKSHYERQIQLGQHQFCSLKCEKDFQHKQSFEIRSCEICHKEFECSKNSSQRFCSPQCQGKWQSTQIGDLNPRSTKIHQLCDWCGKDFLMKQYKLNYSNKHFCSTECSYNWLNNVLYKSQEYKEKSSKRAVKILANGMIPTVYTKPQLMINNILDNLNIDYLNDYNVVYYAIDNYLVNFNLMIEVMGDYWHSNPIKFDYHNLNKTQLNRIIKDKAKHTYIINQYGIEVLYLWETDIINNPTLCELLIQLYISNNGLLYNYHSFNYHINNSNYLELNNQIINTYFDI